MEDDGNQVPVDGGRGGMEDREKSNRNKGATPTKPKAGTSAAWNRIMVERENTIKIHESTIKVQAGRIADLHQQLTSRAVKNSKRLLAKDKEILGLRNLLAAKDDELASKYEDLARLQREKCRDGKAANEVMESKLEEFEERTEDAVRMMEAAEATATAPEEGDEDGDSSECAGTSIRESGHTPMHIESAERHCCVVCKLEEVWRKEDGLKDPRTKNARCQKFLAGCSHKECQVIAHVIPMDHDRKIFKMTAFRGLSCYEIAHSEQCRGLWATSSKFLCTTVMGGVTKERKVLAIAKGDNDVDTGQVKFPSYSVKRSHPIYQSLAKAYGRNPNKRKRRANVSEDCGQEQTYAAEL